VTFDDVAVLDPQVLAELRAATGDDEEFIRDLVATYVDEAPANLAALTAAVAGGDVDAVVRPAHTLKSSSASLGAMRLSAICREIEEAGRAGRLAGLDEAAAAASATWAATVAAFAEAGLTG
jgi:HPt (histidine-containing phosphotransfer) domain-containing protein